MILSGQSIQQRGIVSPCVERTECATGLTYGLGPAGYDVTVEFDPEGRLGYLDIIDGRMALASTIEHFTMPDDILAVVHDKSSLARKGLFVQNTVIEPGWSGHLTLELTYHGHGRYRIMRGQPIAQIVFYELDQSAQRPYDGKYQNQQRGPQAAR